ncbi:MAG: phosphoribosylformylglycinamidine cyclo-ligase [Deltaproteobacteria bacterium]|nr:phosphoribosylformylglycinamidine cyclo-ligase [Deltaproteobacteria bacterium]
MAKPVTYADAGVDVDKANKFVDTIKKIAKETSRSGVLSDIGGFGGMFNLNVANYKTPVLVSSTDGVGTKLKIATLLDKHDTIGIDLVAMCINDIVVQGAKPLFFLDYLSMGQLDTEVATAVISGIADGCKQAKCALIGGETAEMPGFYENNEYDLAGFTVGIVDDNHVIDGSDINVGNQIVGIVSSGLHSNGYSLVRKICFDIMKMTVEDYVPEFGRSLGEELLAPTKIYSEAVQSLIRDLPIRGMAHITGGGIPDNVIRIIPNACQVLIKKDSWDIPPIFTYLQKNGGVTDNEMMRTFNNGIGLIAVVPEDSVQEVLQRLNALDEKAFVIGEVVERKKSASKIRWV